MKRLATKRISERIAHYKIVTFNFTLYKKLVLNVLTLVKTEGKYFIENIKEKEFRLRRFPLYTIKNYLFQLSYFVQI